MKHKSCKQCNRTLPLDSDHFFKKKDTKDGFTNKCKECMGKKFTDKLSKIPKNGFKFCIKCNKELKISIQFFPPDALCKDGFRNVCRSCGKDGHYMKEEYNPKRIWSDEENNLFIERYPHYINKELVEIFYTEETVKSINQRAHRLGIHKSEETKNRIALMKSEQWGCDSPLLGLVRTENERLQRSVIMKGRFVGENSPLYGIKLSKERRDYMSKIKKGNWSGKTNPRHANPLFGELNGRWNGGITPENQKIRNSKEYFTWRDSVFARDFYTCQKCGNKTGGNLEAHHIVNFYSNPQLRFEITNGITLCSQCHNPNVVDSFHHKFGTRENTLEQLHEFFKGTSWSIHNKKIIEEEYQLL